MMIGHLMSTCVVTASPMQSLKSAAKIMEENDFDALPICDNHRVIGMLTVRDIAMKAVAQGLSLAESKISEFMTFETAVDLLPVVIANWPSAMNRANIAHHGSAPTIILIIKAIEYSTSHSLPYCRQRFRTVFY